MTPHKPHARSHIHEPETFGEALADKIAGGLGTWRAILIQASITALWFLANTLAIIHHWDPYPFVFLNLGYSIEAGFSTFVILLSQKRSAQKDHRRDEVEAREVHLLYRINRQQLALLILWPAVALTSLAILFTRSRSSRRSRPRP